MQGERVENETVEKAEEEDEIEGLRFFILYSFRCHIRMSKHTDVWHVGPSTVNAM